MGPQQPHRKRCKRWDRPGDAHYLTFSCFMRQRFLRRQRPCLWLLESLDRVRAKRPFDLWGFVIMPEHLHLLLLPHEGVKISSILQSLKLPVTQRAIRYVQDHDPRFLQQSL